MKFFQNNVLVQIKLEAECNLIRAPGDDGGVDDTAVRRRKRLEEVSPICPSSCERRSNFVLSFDDVCESRRLQVSD